MEEQIMVTDNAWVNHQFGEDSLRLIRIGEKRGISLLESNYSFTARSCAESNNAYKQIVSYCLIESGDCFFITQRKKKQTENRLHNMFSLGIGGHIGITDVGSGSVIMSGLIRELSEEVDIRCGYSLSFLGLINDNSSEVSAVHIGVCYLVKLSGKMCFVKETEKMSGFWIQRSELASYYDKLEGWSKILANSIEQKSNE